jgi:phthiodiolone/phenolphthiodiolone dimycocerosates ketoreductase
LKDSVSFFFVDSGVGPLECLEDGVRAEKAGFDAVWLPDHYVDVDCERLEPWTMLSAIAARTRKIRLGSGVTDTQRTHPTRTAHMVAGLDVLSKGRTILGIGAGEAMNTVPFGLPWESRDDRLKRLEEAIKVITLLWDSSIDQQKNFTGQFYSLKKAHLDQPPMQKPHPSIYIGAIASRKALEIVGRLGDGWYGWLNTPQTFKERWKIISDSAKSVGRSPKEIKPSTHLMVSFPRNSEEKKAALLGAKTGLLFEKSVLRSLGGESYLSVDHYQHLDISREGVKKIFNNASSIPDEFVHKVMAVSGIEEVKEKIEEYSKAGVQQFAVCDIVPPRNVDRIMKLFPRLIKEYS